MNFASKIDSAIRAADAALQNAEQLQRDYVAAKDYTSDLLEKCAQQGITKVSVSKKHKSVPSSEKWPWHGRGNIFAFSPKNQEQDHPAIWGVVAAAGIGRGCGNNDQYSIDDSGLVDGVYHYKQGKWKKVD